MTNVFGWNMTENTEEIDGAVFLTRTLSEEQNAALDRLVENNTKINVQAQLPLPLRIAKGIACFGFWIILLSILKADVSLAEGYRNAPGFYWAIPVCLVVWLTLFFVGRHRLKRLAADPALQEHIDIAENLTNMAREALGIPDDAKSIDVWAERYVIKDGEAKHKEFGMTNYLNLDVFIFYEDGNLCLADLRQRLDIPLRSVHSMRLEKKRKSFPEWHKEESYDDPKFKPFKLTTNQFDHIFSRYYRVEISDAKGEFYLLIPEFDGETFTEITQIRPEMEEN